MLDWILNEKTLTIIGGLVASSLVASATANLFVSKKKNKNDVEFIPDEEFIDEVNEEVKPIEAEIVNKEPVVLDVDQQGNVITPIRFNHDSMIINTEPV
mgnify:CR=1 FL=1